MKKNSILSVLIMLCGVCALAQSATLRGKVFDKQTKTPLPNVNIYIESQKVGTATDSEGMFSLSVDEGTHTLTFSLVGYVSTSKQFSTQASQMYTIELQSTTHNLGEVKVTARKAQKAEASLKLDVPLKDVPVTLSTVNNELLEQVQVTTINDALRYVTGIKPTVNYGGFQTFKMRGFGAPVIMVDGARDERMNFSNSAPMTSLAAVERIEYLKGPASVLYGHSAVGGILNVVRKQPTEAFHANVSASYGSWNSKDALVGIGGSLTSKTNYRFDANYGEKDGWRNLAQDYLNAYLALDHKIDATNKIEVRIGANDDFYATETGFPIFQNNILDENGKTVYKKGDIVSGFDRKQRYNDPNDFLKHKNINGSAKYIHNFSKDSKLSFHGSYSYDYIDYFATESLNFLTSKEAVYQNHYVNKYGEKTYINLDTLQRDSPLRFAHKTKTYQNYLEYTTKLRTGSLKHNLLGGYYLMIIDRVSHKGYGEDDIWGTAKYAKIAVVNPSLNQGSLHEKFSKASIYHEVVNGFYVQDLLEISAKVKALAALRFDHYKMGYQAAKMPKGRLLEDISERSSIVNTPFSYRLGLVYEPTEDVSLYASYANFFKPRRSTYSNKYIYIDKHGKEFFPEEGKKVFEPETGYQVEAGFRYNVSSKLQLNGAAYYIEKENIVEKLDTIINKKKVYAQIGLVASKGFEIDAIIKPLEGWNITAGYSYSNATYKDFSNNKYISAENNASRKNKNEGNYLRRNPKNQFFVWSYYEVPKGFLKNLNVGLGANYTDPMYTSSSNSYQLPEYWLTEAAIGYRFKNVSLKLKVNNLLNTEYFSNSVYSTQFIPGRERNFLFTIGYKL